MPKPLMCPPDLLARDLAGRTILVTGGNSGIGLETVAQLAKQGANVILASRSASAGTAARDAALTGAARERVRVVTLDLADLASVRACAATVLAHAPTLHALVNNAGVMNTPRGRTRDGFETQFGINHLGHVLLTDLLLPALQAAGHARIVNVSSCYHDVAVGRPGRIDLADPHFERRRYDGWAAYAQSKLANVLHARSLARLHAAAGVTAVSLHPGWVRTRLIRPFLPLWVQDGPLRPLLRGAGMLEPWEGTQTTLHALLSPDVDAHPGGYFSQVGTYRDRAANAGGWPLRSPNPLAHDDALADELHAYSRSAVGLPAA
jgi:NAD(P)-dependent dehydrogenase (short-subunit alcohol dehydrogenase family)